VKKPAVSAVKAENVAELGATHDEHPWRDLPAREIPAEDWQRFRGYVAEIFEAFGTNCATQSSQYGESPRSESSRQRSVNLPDRPCSCP
jgi:hypothetical protein